MNRQVTHPPVVVAAEGVARSEGGSSDVLHVPAVQPQTGAAPGDDGAADPRSDRRSAASSSWLRHKAALVLHHVAFAILRSGSGAELLESPAVPGRL